jgi:hypothetical protein
MIRNVWIEEIFFDSLRDEAFSLETERREYEGVLRLLHDIPFYWDYWLDENRAADAIAHRQDGFLATQRDLFKLDQEWLNAWANSAASSLEVLLGIARRWNDFFEGPVPFYFGHLFNNLGLTRYPGRYLLPHRAQEVRVIMDDWMSHQFQSNGVGSPFPLRVPGHAADMTQLDIWSQMNAYSAENFQ